MKKILLDNALESWSIAVKYCNKIKNGLCTLHYQKTFVSSLHNAIELLLKQIMLDNNDHSIIDKMKVKSEDDALLQLNYYKATSLNEFFKSLSDEDRNKLHSIEFKDLIEKSTQLIKSALTKLNVVSIKEELKKLQNLRNNETHFYISKADYLSEDDFVVLHNLMFTIFEVMQEYHLLPYWGEAWDKYKHLEFITTPINSFSYSTAVRSSPIAKSVSNTLSGKQLFCYSDEPFDLAEQYFDELNEANEQSVYTFNEILSIITMMKHYEIISFISEQVSDEIELDTGEIIPPQYEHIIDITL